MQDDDFDDFEEEDWDVSAEEPLDKLQWDTGWDDDCVTDDHAKELESKLLFPDADLGDAPRQS